MKLLIVDTTKLIATTYDKSGNVVLRTQEKEYRIVDSLDLILEYLYNEPVSKVDKIKLFKRILIRKKHEKVQRRQSPGTRPNTARPNRTKTKRI